MRGESVLSAKAWNFVPQVLFDKLGAGSHSTNSRSADSRARDDLLQSGTTELGTV